MRAHLHALALPPLFLVSHSKWRSQERQTWNGHAIHTVPRAQLDSVEPLYCGGMLHSQRYSMWRSMLTAALNSCMPAASLGVNKTLCRTDVCQEGCQKGHNAVCVDAGTRQEQSMHSSTPVPRAKQGPRRWQAEVGADGLLQGPARPPASEEVRSHPDLPCAALLEKLCHERAACVKGNEISCYLAEHSHAVLSRTHATLQAHCGC